MDKARVTVTVKGKNLEVLDKIAAANQKQRGEIAADMINEVLASLIPVLSAESESKAYKVMFQQALTKLADLFEE